MKFITIREYMMDRAEKYPPSIEMWFSACELIHKVNILLSKAGLDRRVTSGYRPPAINSQTPGASPTSKHMTCQAVDVEDHNKELIDFCYKNRALLEELGLYIEVNTPGWVHAQTVAPASGHRFFLP